MMKIHLVSVSIVQLFLIWQGYQKFFKPVWGSDVHKVTIRGAGASFPATVYKRWIERYQTLRQKNVHLKMPYESTGSGRGNELMLTGTTIEYAGTEQLLDPNKHPNLVFFPTMAGSIGLAYNLPEVERAGLILNLTREQVVGIFNGTFNNWNDSTFHTSNPNVQMPDEKIIVVTRREKSGTTGIFTSALSAFSQAWKRQYGMFYQGINETTDIPHKWNESAITYYGKQSSGLAGIVASIKYTIGYVSVSESKGLLLRLANIQNKNGHFISSEEETAIIDTINEHMKLTKSLTGSLVNLPGQNTYPIVGFTYMIVRLKAPGPCAAVKELVRYIDWFSTSSEAKTFAKLQGMVLITRDVSLQVKRDVLQKITCEGRSVWKMVEEDKAMEKYQEETWRTPLAATVPFVVLLILLLLIYIIHQRLKLMKMINNDEWNIDIEDILFYFDEKWSSSQSKVLCNKSIRSLKSLDEIPEGELILSQILQWPGRWKAHQIGIRLLNLSLNNINRRTKRELIWMRDQILHQNVLKFYGLTQVDIGNTYVVSEYSSKGSLVDILQDNKFNLTKDFKFSLSIDIANGMSFLHTIGVVHGYLRTSCCMLDCRWMVKIADWEYCRVYSVLEPTKNPILQIRKNSAETGDYALAFKDFWTAPEILKSSFTKFPTPSCDVYSFAIILQGVFTRCDPYVEYADTMNPTDVLNAIIFHNLRPQLPEDLPLSVKQIMEIAWSEVPASRPSFDQILKLLKHAKPTRKSVLDSMMETMEEYTTDLEDRIEERTRQLEDAEQAMEEYLGHFIPKPFVSNLMKCEESQLKTYINTGILAVELYGFNDLVTTSAPANVLLVLEKIHTLLKANAEGQEINQLTSVSGLWIFVAGLCPGGSGPVQSTVSLAKLALDWQERMLMEWQRGDLQGLELRLALHVGTLHAGHVISPNSLYIFGRDLTIAKNLLKLGQPFEIGISENVKDILSTMTSFDVRSTYGKNSEKDVSFFLSSRDGNVIEEVTSNSSGSIDSGIEHLKKYRKGFHFPDVRIINEKVNQPQQQLDDPVLTKPKEKEEQERVWKEEDGEEVGMPEDSHPEVARKSRHPVKSSPNPKPTKLIPNNKVSPI